MARPVRGVRPERDVDPYGVEPTADDGLDGGDPTDRQDSTDIYASVARLPDHVNVNKAEHLEDAGDERFEILG